MRVRFETSLGAGVLSLPGPLLQEWLAEADPALDRHTVSPENQALLLEARFASELDWLEEALGCRIELTQAGGAGFEMDSALSLYWKESEGDRGGMVAFEDVRLAEAVGTLLDSVAVPSSLASSEVPIPLRLIHGVTSLTYAELDDLGPGDVILFPIPLDGSTGSCCLIAGQRVAPMERTLSGWRLSGDFHPLAGSKWDFDMIGENSDDLDETSEDATLSDLPITLVFEAGRISMPLDEVRRLGAGSLIPLNAPADAGVTIHASGKRVGRGELVRLGEGLGIRVASIFNDG